jgi:hypothetical protein
MRKSVFALLTVLGMSLATGVLAPTADAYTYLITSSHADGGWSSCTMGPWNFPCTGTESSMPELSLEDIRCSDVLAGRDYSAAGSGGRIGRSA